MYNWVAQRPDFKSALRVVKIVLNTHVISKTEFQNVESETIIGQNIRIRQCSLHMKCSFFMGVEENLVMATKSIRVIECGFNALKICIFLWWIIWNLENVEKIGASAANRCDVIYPKKCPHRLWKYRAEILHVVHKRRLNFALLGISAFANLSIACQLANVNHQIHKVVM